MKTLFIGFAVSDDIMEEISRLDRFPQIAAHNFQWSIIQGVEQASGSCMDLLSSAPVSDYPKFPKVFLGYRKWKHRDEADDVLMPFVNLLLLKHISRFFSSLLLIAAWFRKHPDAEAGTIVVYAMHSPYLIAALLASRLFGGKAVLVVPDLPAFSDAGMKRGVIREAAKALDIRLLPWLSRRFDGVVVVSKHIAEDLSLGDIPYIVVDNAVPAHHLQNGQEEVDTSPAAREKEIVVMYAGGLMQEYGVTLLLDAFSMIPDRNYRLWICGRGPLEAVVQERALRDPRIVCWGFLPNDDVITKEKRATVLVNARPSTGVFTRYSCPYKLLEFMLSARPTISTALQGIPDEYKDFMYILDTETPERLSELIVDVCTRPPEELAAFGRRARDFVRREKSFQKQGQRIHDFMVQLRRSGSR